MSTILITGGTGLIGKPLSKALVAQGHEIIILSRHKPQQSPHPSIGFSIWDPQAGIIDREVVKRADYIIHLAGAGVAEKRWTKERKEEIVQSRVKSGELLVRTLNETTHSVKALLSASAIGWYGEDPTIPNPNPFVETDPSSPGFLGKACLLWEKSLDGLKDSTVRVVKFRTGIVLSMEGGALKEFAKPLRAGLATILGSGTQMISWLHIDDMVRLYIDAISNTSMSGVYNAVAPVPVSNKELVIKLADLERKKFYIPVHVPAFALKLAMGEMSTEVLKSTTVSCDKLHVAGYTFLFPTIDAALRELVKG